MAAQPPRPATDLAIKVFADGADLATMKALRANPVIKGFTTNPSLMRKAGVSDYAGFAKAALEAIPDMPISFEVFADDFEGMETEAKIIATWGSNVYVKIPVIDAQGQSAAPLLARLTAAGVKLNVTAIYTEAQLQAASDALRGGAPSVLSVFAGRLADMGWDPLPLVKKAVALANENPGQEVIWASTREVWNVLEADALGVHIITAPNDVIAKLAALGEKSPDALALETVRTFVADAKAAGLSLN